MFNAESDRVAHSKITIHRSNEHSKLWSYTLRVHPYYSTPQNFACNIAQTNWDEFVLNWALAFLHFLFSLVVERQKIGAVWCQYVVLPQKIRFFTFWNVIRLFCNNIITNRTQPQSSGKKVHRNSWPISATV